ncbi:hypothetical protein WJX73_002851 [Symbiochloris irregularis]|uniref:G-patch domain-containing protein n=1 Tax=Symbiochloris irregularis TaxID=706552 RepID=A0AAW1NVB4_9CHLO
MAAEEALSDAEQAADRFGAGSKPVKASSSSAREAANSISEFYRWLVGLPAEGADPAAQQSSEAAAVCSEGEVVMDQSEQQPKTQNRETGVIQLPGSNIGYKLLQKAGWQEGTGLVRIYWVRCMGRQAYKLNLDCNAFDDRLNAAVRLRAPSDLHTGMSNGGRLQSSMHPSPRLAYMTRPSFRLLFSMVWSLTMVSERTVMIAALMCSHD